MSEREGVTPKQCCKRDYNFDGNCDQHPVGVTPKSPEQTAAEKLHEKIRMFSSRNTRAEWDDLVDAALLEAKQEALQEACGWIEYTLPSSPQGTIRMLKRKMAESLIEGKP